MKADSIIPPDKTGFTTIIEMGNFHEAKPKTCHSTLQQQQPWFLSSVVTWRTQVSLACG